MALTFQHRAAASAQPESGARIVLFPGAWNPPTVAHVAIARAARALADEVVWLLPRAFPHKAFEGATFEQRLSMLCRIARSEPGFSVAVTDAGLYFEMADEARAHFGPGTEIALLCGKDAAERITQWDYGQPGVFDRMIERYPLLVAARAGDYAALPHHAGRVTSLSLGAEFDEVSSTELRNRIANGLPWRHLLPAEVAESAEGIY